MVITRNDLYKAFKKTMSINAPEWLVSRVFSQMSDEDLAKQYNMIVFDKGRFCA